LPGDIIIKLEDISIATREDLLDALDYYKGGTTVNLTVQRRVDGTFREMQIQVTLGYRKDYVKE
ncbi:MAG: PDZ domain-containing protein, partial [Lachnospiraceae bacterium]|nr:PDZ domain-containing protein [Lachnospiraceae bacterium]